MADVNVIKRRSFTRHGCARPGKITPEFRSWAHMRRRCKDQRDNRYDRYGGRGIVVCERWQTSFAAFLADMGPKPTPQHSIDRIDNDGNYEPGNCRWATRREQGNNTKRNRLLTLNGETMTVTEWSRKVGIHNRTIRARLARGWTVQDALLAPLTQV